MITYKDFKTLGQLGNQMFFYSLVRTVADKLGYEYGVPDWEGRHFFPETSQDKFPEARDYNIFEEKTHGYREGAMAFDDAVLEVPDNTAFHGYFQNYHYYWDYKKQIQKWLEPSDHIKNTVASLEIPENACSLHFRVGHDVFAHGTNIFPFMSWQYYADAIDEIGRDKIEKLILVSDVDESTLFRYYPELKGFSHVQYLHNAKEIDMFTLSACKYQILSPSTFAWWAAFLNKSAEKVVAPTNWASTEFKWPCNIICPDWKDIQSPNHYRGK